MTTSFRHFVSFSSEMKSFGAYSYQSLYQIFDVLTKNKEFHLCLTKSPAFARESRPYTYIGKPANDFCVMWTDLCNFLLVLNRNLGPITHCFQYTTIFRLRNTHFSNPPPLNPKFENVPLALDHCNFTENYSCKKFSGKNYQNTCVTDRQTYHSKGPDL